MKKLIFYIFIFQAIVVNAQIIVKYKDSESKKWGYKNTKTDTAICEPIFDKVNDFNDSLALVEIDKVFGIIDTNGNVSYPENYEHLFLFHENDKFKITESKKSKDKKRVIFGYIGDHRLGERIFMVNSKCECIYNRHFPCPVGVNTNQNTLPESYKLLRGFEYEFEKENFPKMFEYAQKAIEIEPENPYLYVFITDILMNSEKTVKYQDTMKLYLEKAEQYILPYSFEERFLLYSKFNYYNYYEFSQEKLKTISKEFVEKRYGTAKFSSTSFLLGINYGINSYLSVGMGESICTISNKVIKYTYHGGISIMHGLNNKTTAFKINVLHYYSPISIGLYPILFYNREQVSAAWGIKPEIGTSFYNTVLTYGYTFVSKNKFVNDRAHSINLYFYINTSKNKDYKYLDFYY